MEQVNGLDVAGLERGKGMFMMVDDGQVTEDSLKAKLLDAVFRFKSGEAKQASLQRWLAPFL